MDKLYILPKQINIDKSIKSKIIKDYKNFAEEGIPADVEKYILEEYSMDISSRYGEKNIKNPFGIASGQLTTNYSQIESSINEGIGFAVLKTVISQDGKGKATMDEWRVNAPKMLVEKIQSEHGEWGYTVTWKGRGWHKSFRDYLDFMEKSLTLSKERGVPVIPSCKFNLPAKLEEAFNIEEYKYTLENLLKSWQKIYGKEPMYLEKDFSPTLAGSDLSKNQMSILRWINEVPKIIKEIIGEENIYLGLKLMNTTFSQDFQRELLNSTLGNNDTKADYLICFNRLFDKDKVFEGKQGVAYGGYDLSHRNLNILTEFRKNEKQQNKEPRLMPISATGNIESGKMMVEYALRGCENGQIHTFFQIPSSEYAMKNGGRVSKALHELIFNPEKGLLSAMVYLNEKGLIEKNNGVLRFKDITTAYGREEIFGRVDL